MTCDKLVVMTWNVRGIGNSRKAKVVKSWISRNVKEFHVLEVQELKVVNWATRRWLRGLRNDGSVILDNPVGTKGGTALILHPDCQVLESGVSGRGRLAWAKVKINNKEMASFLDTFFYAASPEGVRYTRFARRGALYDFARLDRVYVSGGAQWMDHVKEVRDYGAKCTSDHVPVTVILQLEEVIERSKESYFKMNAAELENLEILQKVQEEWGKETERVRDDRRKWARGWFRVKQVLKKVRQRKERQRRMGGDLAEEVNRRRGMLTGDSGEVEHEALVEAEIRLRDRELQDAKAWKLRSREKWLSTDEAPSRYFFSKLKAKWSREKLEMLELEDGEVTESTRKYWKDLVDEGCIRMIQAVWAKKSILVADCQSVIKLIPKDGDKRKLHNWRPISLMMLSYKIMAKILANKISNSRNYVGSGGGRTMLVNGMEMGNDVVVL
ncbi:hypothetical protein R1sor_002673 [Riccia sorocarpa]|uniref:Endonuclease/exonuclease/phosphatase domain-containing protein n=1 Tax=Riccia sorocarpa TaxID=122646 RepID=A0ABD3H145_9MARC